jgi:hypothetical protein
MVIIQYVIVALIVASCTVFSVWRLISPRLRLRAVETLAPFSGAVGGKLLAQLRQKALAQLSGGCSACSRATNTVNATFPPANRRPAAPHR